MAMMAGCQAQRPPQSHTAGTTPTVLDVSGPRPPRQPSVYVMPTAMPAAYGAPAGSSGPAYLPPDGSDLPAASTGSNAAAQPQLVASAADSTATAPKPVGVQAKTYLVKHGDTLFRIAKEHYGSGSQWHRIAAANPGLTPATLKAGQKLLMP
jgi:5'-nucleotidase/UDP-sugar diphosphatase